MRISTSMMHQNSVNLMLKRQAEMAKTQEEVASGLRVQKPSDDPAAAVLIQRLQQQQAAANQYDENIGAVTSRLEMDEQAMADAESVLQRVIELGIQANSSALSVSDKQSIATELDSLRQQLLDVANRKDANGEYLFSGYASNVQPFVRQSGGSVSYAGDQAARNVQIGATQYVADGDSGQSVFMAVPEGNGLFALQANNTNTGAGVISGAVSDSAAWVPDDYTLSFTSATAWEVRDSGGTLVTSGTYEDGVAIEFNGVSVTVTGTPAAGDQFVVAQSRTESIFDTLDAMIATVRSVSSTDAQAAAFQNDLSTVMTQLDQAETHILNVRAGIGARMSMLESVSASLDSDITQTETRISELRDADYTESVSKLSQQYIGLQAAQQSYSKISQLSLFNYL
jgi:flagellar hook-associated protein 3 FlgL